MYDTGGTYTVCRPSAPDQHLAWRLSWLGQQLSAAAERRRLALEEEECRAFSMLRPRTTEEAYRTFGTFLGLIPPLALFGRAILNSGLESETLAIWVALCAGMNALCCLTGRKFGGYLGRWAGDPRSHTRTGFALRVLFMALAWGVVTGAAGGALCFGFGAIFGVFCAVPVALAAFPAFAILHRLLSHGGMIEGRHVRPLALGVPMTIAAMILSPWLV